MILSNKKKDALCADASGFKPLIGHGARTGYGSGGGPGKEIWSNVRVRSSFHPHKLRVSSRLALGYFIGHITEAVLNQLLGLLRDGHCYSLNFPLRAQLRYMEFPPNSDHGHGLT